MWFAQNAKVWEALAECLGKIPARNQVLVVGDMNVQLPCTSGITGTAVSKQAYRDINEESRSSAAPCSLRLWRRLALRSAALHSTGLFAV